MGKDIATQEQGSQDQAFTIAPGFKIETYTILSMVFLIPRVTLVF